MVLVAEHQRAYEHRHCFLFFVYRRIKWPECICWSWILSSNEHTSLVIAHVVFYRRSLGKDNSRKLNCFPRILNIKELRKRTAWHQSRVGLPAQAGFLGCPRTANRACPSTTASWHTNQAGLWLGAGLRVTGRGGGRPLAEAEAEKNLTVVEKSLTVSWQKKTYLIRPESCFRARLTTFAWAGGGHAKRVAPGIWHAHDIICNSRSSLHALDYIHRRGWQYAHTFSSTYYTRYTLCQHVYAKIEMTI